MLLRQMKHWIRPRQPSHPRADGQAGGQTQEDDDALGDVEDVEAGQQLVLGALVVRDGGCVLAALEGLVGEQLHRLPVQQRVRRPGALQAMLNHRCSRLCMRPRGRSTQWPCVTHSLPEQYLSIVQAIHVRSELSSPLCQVNGELRNAHGLSGQYSRSVVKPPNRTA